ncbi:Phage protein D-like protein [Rhodococcus rhodochrous ATCC 21198]|uniref:phage late control D family protein n=1 Tax=Rhodococcus aetherivorans TaxID=191292 RepID=UPI0003E20985|nr:contractile injection system protein, VgrG/Pvc8 family [Rhodococcus aetherivorans]ETT24109.1 Phage protein D-like protein [Rhodococcus rhodochrous ATCC 21198]NGP26678.1 phage late control D family protein [Rhodococcus aetherivorans]
MTLATSVLYTARPVVELDDAESAELTARVLSVVVTETTEGLFRCELVAGNWSGDPPDGYVFNTRDTVDFGSRLGVRLGDGDRAGSVFHGVVTGIEAHYPESRTPEIVFLAEDRLQDLRMTRRTRSFDDVADADVIREVVNTHGLTPSIDVEGPTHRHIAQLNQSDLAFIRDRAHMLDADLWIDGSTVHVARRSQPRGDEVTLTYNSDLRELSVLADLAHQRSKIVVAGWDVAAKEPIVAEADVAVIHTELGGDIAGVDLLARALTARTETLVHTTPSTSAQARAQADTALRTTARRFVTATGRTEGDARLRVGTRVNLAGLGAGFSGRYTLIEVEHIFDAHHGYQTRFRAERPGLAGAP